MAPWKQITNDATFKGKAIETTGGKASLLTTNHSHTDKIDSISLHNLSANVQLSQQWEDQLLQMLYKMWEQMKEQQLQFDYEREWMTLDRENIIRE